MNFIDPPGGRPLALLALCGGSIFLNVVLIARMFLTGGESDVTVAEIPATEEPAADAAAAVVPDLAAPAVVPADMHVIGVDVKNSLSYTFNQADKEHGDVLSAVYARLFFADLHLRTDLQKGDKIHMAFTWDRDLPLIAAASYESIQLGRTLNAYQFKATGDAFPSWWNEDGQEASIHLLNGPIENYDQITSLIKDRPTHHGMDFKAPEGTPVKSPRNGRVSRVNWNWSNNGNCVEVTNDDGTTAKYLHLSHVDVAEGQAVTPGTLVGLVGNTGHSTAAHLHYELEKNGKIIDPVDYHGTERRMLPASDKAAFDVERARLEGILASANTL